MQDFPPYPLFLNLAQRHVLIVGGGAVGLRKAESLIDFGAKITVVSPAFDAGFAGIKGIERIRAPYAATHMIRQAWRLVFAATDAPAVNALVREHAGKRGIFCCRTDEPEEGDFSSGAALRIVVKRREGKTRRATVKSPRIVIAVSTGGASPVLGTRICREAVAGTDPVLPLLVELLSVWRVQVKKEISHIEIRKELLRRLAGPEMEAILREQGPGAAEHVFDTWLKAACSTVREPAIRTAPRARGSQSGRAVKHAH